MSKEDAQYLRNLAAASKPSVLERLQQIADALDPPPKKYRVRVVLYANGEKAVAWAPTEYCSEATLEQFGGVIADCFVEIEAKRNA